MDRLERTGGYIGSRGVSWVAGGVAAACRMVAAGWRVVGAWLRPARELYGRPGTVLDLIVLMARMK